MTLLSNIEFLKAAAELFEQSHESRSSIYITQKRLSEVDQVNGLKDTQDEISQFNDSKPILPNSTIRKSTKSYPILIRITDGNNDKSKKKKYSTTVDSEHLGKFWKEYSQVIKTGATGLKKKEKSKKKKKTVKA